MTDRKCEICKKPILGTWVYPYIESNGKLQLLKQPSVPGQIVVQVHEDCVKEIAQ